MSALQDIDGAIAAAENTASLNLVGGVPLTLNTAESANEVEFGGVILDAFRPQQLYQSDRIEDLAQRCAILRRGS